jgi:hypothetical protein
MLLIYFVIEIFQLPYQNSAYYFIFYLEVRSTFNLLKVK